MKHVRWSLLLLALATMSSCYYDSKEELYANLNNSCETEMMSYSADIRPIILDNCATAGCHVGPNPQVGLDLSTYADLKRIADNGKLVGRITGNGGPIMPQSGKMPPCPIDKISAWVEQGAQEN